MDPSQYNYMHTNDDQYNVAPNAFHPLYGGGASEAGNYHSDGTSGAENYPYHGGVAISGLSPTLGGEGVDYEQFITDYFNGLSYQNSVDASEINQAQWSDPNGTGVPNGWEGYCDHQNAFGPQYGGSGSSTYHYDTASAHMENTSEEEECNFFDFDYESEPEVYDICVEVAMEQELALINTILEVGLASIPKKKQKIPLHTASGKGYGWVMDILQSNHPDKCPRTFSLTRDVYLLLCRELVERYGFRTSHRSAVGILESVGMYLCLLRGMDLKQIDELFDRGTSTVSRQIRKVLRSLERMAVDQIHPWTDQGEVHPYLTSREMYGPFKVRKRK